MQLQYLGFLASRFYPRFGIASEQAAVYGLAFTCGRPLAVIELQQLAPRFDTVATGSVICV
jgi:hypothetical protein